MKFHVERSMTIDADMASVRAHVTDFNKWSAWSPWNIVEPDAPMEVSGTPGEPGHTLKWNGELIGSGTNTLEKVEGDSLLYSLEFHQPWKSQGKTAFHFEESDGSTKVTWTMDSSMPFFLFFMIPMMKSWIGLDYDRGLRMLKAMAEHGNVPAKTTNKGIVDIEGFSYVGIKRTVSMKDLGEVMAHDFGKIVDDIVKKRNISPKHWLTIYPKMDLKNARFTYIAAVSDEGLQGVDLGTEYVRGTIEGGRALEITHDGSYEFLGNAWSMGMMYTQVKKLKQRQVPFEEYWNSPLEVAPEDLKTSVYFPVK